MFSFATTSVGLFTCAFLYASHRIFSALASGHTVDRLPHLAHALSLLRRKWNASPPIPVSQFKRMVDEGARLHVFFGYVIDVEKFEAKHPGGKILSNFNGMDISPWMLITHSKSELALKTMVRLSIGRLDGYQCTMDHFESPLLRSVDQRYVGLFLKYIDDGLFHMDRGAWIGDLVTVYGAYAIGVLLVACNYWALGVCVLCFAGCRQGFFYHDIMHRSVFVSASAARKFVYWTSIFFWGFDFNEVGDLHDIHHAFVNVLEMDGALDMPFLSVHPTQKAYMSSPMQNVFFYGVLAFMVYPAYALLPLVNRFTWKDFLIFLARNALFFYVFPEIATAVGIAIVVGFYYFASIGTLNHFHKPMLRPSQVFGKDPSECVSFVDMQTRSVQNTSYDRWGVMHWMVGHFTLHIEHHLFPLMPRRNYPRITEDIRDLLKEAKVPYGVCSPITALKSFNTVLMCNASQ